MKYNIIRHRIYSGLRSLQLWSDETSQSKSVQEVQQSAAFVPHHAHLLSSKTHNDEQGSDKRKLMSLSLSLWMLSLAAGAVWGGCVLLRVGFLQNWDLCYLEKTVATWQTD